MNNSPEKLTKTPEAEANSYDALEQYGHERQEKLRENHERETTKELSPDDTKDLHKAALEHAASNTAEKARFDASPAERKVRGPLSRRERDDSFTATMEEVRGHMSAPSRAFSRAIHNKAIEKASETVGTTIARPNAILSGAIAAFTLTLIVYLVSKNYGYPLSGFESIGAFIVGWILGNLYDFLKVMITGRK